MRNHVRTVFGLCSLLCGSNFASADSTQPALEPLIVTGTRLDRAPAASETVLDTHRIDAQHAADTLDLLTRTPGVYVANGGPGGISEVFLRGAESNFTVVLIDGVRRNDASNSRGGGYDFSTIDPAEIERIDILRGPLSAIYGSDAMAGAINIITRRPAAAPTVSITAEGSADSDERAFVSFSGPLSRTLHGGAHLIYDDVGHAADGSSRRLQGGQIDGTYDSGSLEIRSGARYVERHRTSYPDASGGERYAVIRDLEHADADETSAWLTAKRSMTQSWNLHLQGSYFARNENIDTPPIAPGVLDGVPGSVSHTEFRQSQVTLYSTFAPGKNFDLSAGADVLKEQATRRAELDLGFAQLPSDFSLDRRTSAVFAEASARPVEALAIYGSVRLDDTNRDRSRTSARLSTEYSLAPLDSTVRLTWANGHKEPSFYSLGDSLVGNPNLRVERSETLEAAFTKRLGDRFTATLAGFRSRYTDLIDFDFATFRLINRSRVRIDGLEASVQYRPFDALVVAATWTQSRFDLDDDARLLYRPKSYGGINASWHIDDHWDVFADARWTAERHGSSVPTGDRDLDSYERIDLSVSRRLANDAKIYFNLDNALDSSYEDAVGFPTRGVQARLGISLALQ
jgi:outer membrane cobalamin receptor